MSLTGTPEVFMAKNSRLETRQVLANFYAKVYRRVQGFKCSNCVFVVYLREKRNLFI